MPRRVRNREQGPGDEVYPSGCSNTPTTAALGTTTGFSQHTPLRQGRTPNSCDQFGNCPLIRTAKLSISHALTDQ